MISVQIDTKAVLLVARKEKQKPSTYPAESPHPTLTSDTSLDFTTAPKKLKLERGFFKKLTAQTLA